MDRSTKHALVPKVSVSLFFTTKRETENVCVCVRKNDCKNVCSATEREREIVNESEREREKERSNKHVLVLNRTPAHEVKLY